MSEIFASVDLGGTKTACVLADKNGKILLQRRMATESYEGPKAVVARIAQTINDMSSKLSLRPVSLGMGVPGLVDVHHGITRFLPNMPTQWRDVPVRELLAPLVQCDVFVLNDARAATLAELTFGHGRNFKDMVFFTIGTGVGGGIVLDGKLRLGPLGAAGEIGHSPVVPNGLPCSCGSKGCLETLASGPAITAEGVRLLLSGQAPELYRITEGSASKVNPGTMAQAAQAGDQNIRLAIERAATYIGFTAATMISALHPELIVFGGGVAEMGDILIQSVRDVARRHVGMFPPDEVRFERSLLGNDAGVLGGIALAMQTGITL